MSFHMLNGLATTQSIPEALVYQTFASLGDSNFAKQALAFQHLAGLGVKKDCEKALVYYQKVAQQVIEDYQSLGITTVANRYNSDITKNIVKLYEWTDPSVKTEADSSAEEEALEWMEFREMKAIQNPEQLVTIVHQEKLSGKKIVMTNGCFDILHAGHVSYLQKARALGDRLIVAVNSDSSVKALKGESRPVNPCSRRMAVLSALSSVDWVVEFSEDTPQQLIAKVLPNTLVKGGDYQIAQIAGHKEVLEAGGDVKVLNFEDGCSTSLIIESILEQSC